MSALAPFRERSYLSTDGLRLYYRDYPGPDGPQRLPMVCLHGLTRNCSDFDEFAAWQARKRRVLTPDVRGRGRSVYDPQWRNYQPARYLEDIWTLLEAAGISHTVVVGTSMGGLIAMLMAAARPQSLAAVVLNDVGPRVAPAGLLQLAGILKRLRPVDSWAEAVRQTRAAYEKALPGLDDAAWEAITRRGWRESGARVEPAFDPNIIRAIRAGLALPEGDPWALFGALEGIPTLLLRGASSEILTAATARKMKRLKPDLAAVEIPGRGHAPLLNEPVAIRAIAEFLQAF